MALPTKITRAAYFDRVLGLWHGKFIGGTLGAPIEGIKSVHHFDENLSLPTAHIENDDTDLQILWLHTLEARGVKLTAEDLMEEWREHVRAPWNEYGVAVANWERGIAPPDSGRVSNWFWAGGMGCPIRAEIWGVISPGAPELAAKYAAVDGSLDHAGDAVEAEKFIAAVVAAIFIENDLITLIRDHGLPVVTANSDFHRLVVRMLDWTASPDSNELIREKILREFGHPDMTHVLQNLGFALLGLLRSEGNFSRAMAIALNCGYDADCTAGIAGAILGGIHGYHYLEGHRLGQLSDQYVVSGVMAGFPRHGSLSSLTQSCLNLARKVGTTFDTKVQLPLDLNEPESPALNVVPQAVPILRSVARPFPTWALTGPFWRNWDERIAQDTVLVEHGIPTLPSAHYFSHLKSGFEVSWIKIKALGRGEFPESIIADTTFRNALDNRLPLDELAARTGPLCYYATTWLRLPDLAPRWLMVGATGPIEVWWNDRRILVSQSHQALTPNTFALEVNPQSGVNVLVLKLARESVELSACVDLKHHRGLHWHQAFYDTSVEWLSASASQAPVAKISSLAAAKNPVFASA